MVAFALVVVLLLIGVLLLILFGLREGDKPGDGLIERIEACISPRSVSVTVRNPALFPLLVGLSLRRRGLRLRLEGGTYARLRSGRLTADLLPSRQTVVGIVDPDEEATFLVPAELGPGSHAELVVVFGQRDRLRSVHRAVKLPALEMNQPAPLSSARSIRA
jgi:hypothetical protein